MPLKTFRPKELAGSESGKIISMNAEEERDDALADATHKETKERLFSLVEKLSESEEEVAVETAEASAGAEHVSDKEVERLMRELREDLSGHTEMQRAHPEFYKNVMAGSAHDIARALGLLDRRVHSKDGLGIDELARLWFKEHATSRSFLLIDELGHVHPLLLSRSHYPRYTEGE